MDFYDCCIDFANLPDEDIYYDALSDPDAYNETSPENRIALYDRKTLIRSVDAIFTARVDVISEKERKRRGYVVKEKIIATYNVLLKPIGPGLQPIKKIRRGGIYRQWASGLELQWVMEEIITSDSSRITMMRVQNDQRTTKDPEAADSQGASENPPGKNRKNIRRGWRKVMKNIFRCCCCCQKADD